MERLTKYNPDLEKRKELYLTQRWKQFRYQFLTRYATCNNCDARATVCDHVEGHGDDWAEKFWRGPFQPLCESCHNRKTVKETRAKVKPHVRLRDKPWRR
jgi:5-methylcytosine-specific restriction protein A